MTTAPLRSPMPTVVLLADRRQSRTARMLRNSGYRLMTTYTPDHAVAICVNNRIDVVILDQPHFIETEGWSVAKSLKLVRSTICVILVVRGKLVNRVLPEGVDAIVAENDQDELLGRLHSMLRE